MAGRKGKQCVAFMWAWMDWWMPQYEWMGAACSRKRERRTQAFCLVQGIRGRQVHMRAGRETPEVCTCVQGGRVEQGGRFMQHRWLQARP